MYEHEKTFQAFLSPYPSQRFKWNRSKNSFHQYKRENRLLIKSIIHLWNTLEMKNSQPT